MMRHEPIVLKNTALAITERCTLRCKLCSAFIPYHENPQDLTLSEIGVILSRYFSLISSVDTFCITGGEPLMHPELLAICELLYSYSSQINKNIDITTNGTLLFKDDTIRFLEAHRDKVRVIIGDYGKHSPKAAELAKSLSSRRIFARVDSHNGDSPLYGGWIDCRDHTRKHQTQDQMDEQGSNCVHRKKRGYVIRKGELHNCARSYWRMLNHIIPRNPDEYIDLLDAARSVEEQRIVLRKLNSRASVTSCAYCCGATDRSRRYTPAEQLDSSASRGGA